MKTFQEFLQLCEGGLARQLSNARTKDTGHISADRGDDEDENRRKRRRLEGKLEKKGIGYRKTTGRYQYDDGVEGKEVSYSVTKPKNMSRRKFGKTIRQLGREEGQESVITKKPGKKATLHYTDKSGKKSEGLGKEKPGPHPQKYGETGEKRQRGDKLKDKKDDRSMHYA